LFLSMTLSPVVLAAERPSDGDSSQAPALRKAALAGDLKALQQRQSNARSAASILRALAEEAMPAGLPRTEQTTWKRYAEFLRACSDRIENVVARWEAKLVALDEQIRSAQSERALRAAARQLAEVSRSFSMQYLGLQQEMQAENRKFTALSSIMKTRHDTAKNAIGNVR
jgi:uncharacterized protein YdiU (UPF0061 family)